MGEAAVSQVVLPARQPYLGFREGPRSLGRVSHPPGAPTGKGGAPGRGCISCGQGALLLDRYRAGVSRPRSWAAGFRSAGPGGGPRSGSARAACVGSTQAGLRRGKGLHSSLLFCGDLS